MPMSCSCCGRFPIAGIFRSIFEEDEAGKRLTATAEASASPSGGEGATDAPGYYFYNGTIILLTGESVTAECLVTQGSTIFYAGDIASRPALPDGTVTISLDGACLIPGMIDPHAHVVGAAVAALTYDLSPATIIQSQGAYTIETVKAALQSIIDAADAKTNPVILATGFDPSQMGMAGAAWQDLTLTEFASLNGQDAFGIVVQSGSGHLSYVNQTLLNWAGIDQQTPDPSGGYIGRYADGTLSGVLVEMPAQSLILPAVKSRIPLAAKTEFLAQLVPQIRQVFSQALSVGLTTLNDAALGLSLGYLGERAAIAAARLETAVTPRMACAVYVDEWTDDLPPVLANGPQFNNHQFFVQAVKLFADGSNQGVTGYQTQPYTAWALAQTTDYTSQHTHGNRDLDPAQLAALMKKVLPQQWQVMVHANGDAAVAGTIAAYQSVLEGNDTSLRHRIEHCTLATDDDFTAMTSLGLSPSFLIAHATTWGDVLTNILGEDRAQLLDRCKTALDHGLTIGLHSDHPVSPLGPLQLVQDAVTRITQNGTVLNAGECLTPYQALAAVTCDAAWQCRIDTWVGSLEKSKLADLVVLAQSPLDVAAQDIAAIPVQAVYRDGTLAYQAAA